MQVQYQTNIQGIDKDFNAKSFIAFCALKEVYDEQRFYSLMFEIFFSGTTIETEILTNMENEKNAKLNALKKEYDKKYEELKQANTYRGEFVPSPDYNNHKEELDKEYESKVQEINTIYTAINYQSTYMLQHWDIFKRYKVFSIEFSYQTNYTYEDILAYFKLKGFPKKGVSVTEEFANSMNIYKLRHLMRYEFNTDESTLTALLVMYNRKKQIENIDEKNKILGIFMIVLSIVLLVISCIPGMQGVTGPALYFAITSAVASFIGIVASIASFIDSQNMQSKIKEQNKQTQDLMLKNLPKVKNFVDESIQNPYSMYANGTHWVDGGAGKADYDAALGYIPYKALIEDDFDNSDMFEVLHNRHEMKAGGEQFFPELYADAKWTNPSSLKAILNGHIPIYMNMKEKLVAEIGKWLTKEDLGTFYMKERDYDDDDEWWDRTHMIEFEDEKSIYGFTRIKARVTNTDLKLDKKLTESFFGGLITTTYNTDCLYYEYNVNTKWDKSEEDKIETKTSAITDSIHIFKKGDYKQQVKGKDIRLKAGVFGKNIKGWSPASNSNNFSIWDSLSHTDFIDGSYKIGKSFDYFDSETLYECEYEIWTYGNIEVYQYKSIKGGDVNLTNLNTQIYTQQRLIWEVRKELANVSMRFRGFGLLDVSLYREDLATFSQEELNQEPEPTIKEAYAYRFADEDIMFALSMHMPALKRGECDKVFIAHAIGHQQKQHFVKTTVYYNDDDSKKPITYFGINNFLDFTKTIVPF